MVISMPVVCGEFLGGRGRDAESCGFICKFEKIQSLKGADAHHLGLTRNLYMQKGIASNASQLVTH